MPEALEDDYDAVTLARIDRHAARGSRPGPQAAGGWRGRTAAGALAAGLVLGLQEVFHGERGDEQFAEVDLADLDRGAAVTLLFVPGEPRRSIAWVRPWLLR
jgi:hypothetical protein